MKNKDTTNTLSITSIKYFTKYEETYLDST